MLVSLCAESIAPVIDGDKIWQLWKEMHQFIKCINCNSYNWWEKDFYIAGLREQCCRMVDVLRSAVICHRLCSGCAFLRESRGLLVINEEILFWVASPNACDNEQVKLKDDRRAVGLLRLLQNQRERNDDTLWGGDKSTRVRPRHVKRIGNKCEAPTKCMPKLTHSDNITHYTIIKPCKMRWDMGSTYIVTWGALRIQRILPLTLKLNDRATRPSKDIEPMIMINRKMQPDTTISRPTAGHYQ